MNNFQIWGPVVSAIAAIIGCTWRMSKLAAGLQASMEHIDHRVLDLEHNRYKISDAAEAALRTAIENPGFRVIDPRDPTRIITTVGNVSRPS